MSWSQVNKTEDGRSYVYYSGPPIKLSDAAVDLAKISGGVDILRDVYLVSTSTLMWDAPQSEVEAAEKAELKRLKAKYPNV